MLNQALRAALFDGSVFSEIDDNPESMFRAVGVVVVAAIAFGLGVRSFAQRVSSDDQLLELNLIMFVGMATIVTSWAIWAGMVWLLGTRLFQGKAGYRGLLRALGISYGPVFLWLFFNIPLGGPLLSFGGHIWVLAVGVLAVQRAQEFAWWKAVISAAVGWLWALVILPFIMVVPPP